ncbi:hypothetical protein EMPS_08880 [Entomortierella parvispora]|uniref:Amino acid transporter transmembrane domain-containing protein n=1 Tax=Entomortierella parvispora TaxID=205924 RepID=A0A9P3HH56_9FUNG|nr:hypothetical protein EMPS_08880 [Entomortierella parvispora]
MAASTSFERLSVPLPLGAAFCASSPPAPLSASSTATASGPAPAPGLSAPASASASHDPASSGGPNGPSSSRDHLTVLTRSVSHTPSRHSHRSSVSSRRSVSSIKSHISSFQNVRFDPDPIKDISFWGGLALLISNMTGPGIVTLPIVAQSAGWLPTLIAFAVVGILSTLSSLFICEAMTEVPGNEYFQSNVEFSNLVLCFFGKRYHLLVQIICFLAMQTTNVASIAVSAQLFDNLLIKIFHRTCGLEIYPHPSFICVTEQLASASPFSGIMIMTAGVLLAFSMILPLGLLKLSENIWLQLASFVLILLIVLQWIVTFFIHGLDTDLVPAVGSDISQTFGTILFNYAFITTVPSWANAKQPSVSIHKTVNWGVGITTVLYLLVAILGGMAFQIPNNSTLIQAISSSPDVTILSQITGYTFPIAALITSIPINIIVIRYNLIQSGACNMMWSNILSGVLPWLVAVPCMTGSGLTTVINWSSLFLVSSANFIIPFILYIYSKRHKEKLSKLPIIEMEQQARLSREISRSSFSGHSRRHTSASGSIRRRLTGSSLQLGHSRSQSYLDLSIAPPTAIAAASVIPVAFGIGSSSLIQQSVSEENLASESSRPVHRRHHSHHSGIFGPSSASEQSVELVNGPYFSFSRDGELFERESSNSNVDPSHPRSQTSSMHRPSGVSTVVLHDPVTEMAQRKTTLPRRVSHKDKLLSMLSDKHKRAMEQQTKIRDAQNEKPVPPMILLSQSTADLGGDSDEDDEHSRPSFGFYEHEDQGSHDPEKMSEKDVNTQSKEISEANSNLSSALKKMNRQSGILTGGGNSRSTLGLPHNLSSPRLNTTFPELRSSSADGRPSTPQLERAEHTLEPSPTFSPPRSPSSPQRSALKRSPTGSPGLPSIKDVNEAQSHPSNSLRDSLKPEMTALDSTRLGPSSGSGSATSGVATPFNFQVHHSPSTPDSAGSIHSLDRRVSFSDESRLAVVPSQELERKPSFSSETKRAVKAAVVSLTGGSSPHRDRTSANRSPSQEWKMTLLRDQEEETQGDVQSLEEEAEDTIGPELSLAGVGKRGGPSQPFVPSSDDRRNSLGRMAAAFVSQPGSFSIQTQVSPPRSSKAAGSTTQGNVAPFAGLAPSLTEPIVESSSPEGSNVGGMTLSLSPSAPPSFPEGHVVGSRGRTVSASAALQERTSRMQRYASKTLSTQSLKEQMKAQAGPGSANSLSIHLTPPSPSVAQQAQFEAMPGPTSAETHDSVSPLPPSPGKPPLHHRVSVTNRISRGSGSHKTLTAPFQGGNNYAIPGFGSSHNNNGPATSPVYSPTSPDQEQPQSATGFGSSWFNRMRHSRDPSRSTMASTGVPPTTISVPPSPLPMVPEPGGGVGRLGDEAMLPSSPTAMPPSPASEMTEYRRSSLYSHFRPQSHYSHTSERPESQVHESQFHLPQYGAAAGLAFEAMWSLRAIPSWIPISSIKIAWGSLVILALAITATIVYDFVQLGMGNDVNAG